MDHHKPLYEQLPTIVGHKTPALEANSWRWAGFVFFFFPELPRVRGAGCVWRYSIVPSWAQQCWSSLWSKRVTSLRLCVVIYSYDSEYSAFFGVTSIMHWDGLQLNVKSAPPNLMPWCSATKKMDCSLWVVSELLPQVKEFRFFGMLLTSEGKMWVWQVDRCSISSTAGVVLDRYGGERAGSESKALSTSWSTFLPSPRAGR